MSTTLTPVSVETHDPGFSEVPDLVYVENDLISLSAVLLLDAIVGGRTYPQIAADTEGFVDLAELIELGYVTVEDRTGGEPVVTVTDFGHVLLSGVQANHPDVLPCD